MRLQKLSARQQVRGTFWGTGGTGGISSSSPQVFLCCSLSTIWIPQGRTEQEINCCGEGDLAPKGGQAERTRDNLG